MPLETASLPGDLAAAHAMILAERAARLEAEARVGSIQAEMSGARLEIERLRLLLAKARRERYGQSAERGARLVEQLELQLAELEETVAEEDAAAELGAFPSAARELRARASRRPARRPLPEHLPRERIVYPAPCASNNAAERALRGIAVGRRNWTFAGSDAGGRRAAALYTLIETAKLNDVDPHAWPTF